MLQVLSPLKGFAIEASDGRVGTVADFLFDDSTWKVRWIVVDCGTWLSDRKVLIHPSAITFQALEEERLQVNLTKAQVEGSPELAHDEPVSQQMEGRLYTYYGWDPYWGGSLMGTLPGAMSSPMMSPPYFENFAPPKTAPDVDMIEKGDPHLRSFVEMIGYHLHAMDGEIGHFENFVIDGAGWSVAYFIVDTSNWWFGKRVLMSPIAAKTINWFERQIDLDVTREQVKDSPPWDPLKAFDEVYSQQLHRHYGWPGSGL
jgi:hypothetical protein